MTQFLGFKNYGEEYKMMGLAPYGKPKFFQKIMDHFFESGSTSLVQLNLKYFNHWKPGYRYIAGDNLEIDQIFDNKLNDLFHEEKVKSKMNLRDFASSVQKVCKLF